MMSALGTIRVDPLAPLSKCIRVFSIMPHLSDIRIQSTTKKIILVALVVALALAVRLYRLGDENLWIDEVHQVRVSSQSYGEIIRNYVPDAELGTFDQAPLSFLITHPFLAEPHAEFWVRLPPALFGTLGVLGMFLLARQLLPFGPSLLAALFLAVSPLHVWYSQEARWYSQWVCLTILSYIALIRAADSSSRWPWVGYAVATLANLYTFIFTPFVVAAQGLSLWCLRSQDQQRNRTIRTFFLVVVVVLVAAGPVIRMVVSHAGTAYSGTARESSMLELPYSFIVYSVGFTVGPTLVQLHQTRNPFPLFQDHLEVVPLFLIFLAISLLGIKELVQNPRLACWVAPWLVLPPAAVFLVGRLMTDMTYQARYTLASLPAFIIVLAIGVWSLKGAARWAAGGAVLASSLFSLSNMYWAEEYNRADVRGALEYIRSVDSEETQILVVGQVRIAMPLYADKLGTKIVTCGAKRETAYAHVITGGSEGNTPAIFDEFDPSRRVWALSGRDWENDAPQCLEMLSSSYTMAEKAAFPGVDLWRFEPRADGD